MKRKFSLVMSAAMILSIIAPMTNALAEDIQTPETASTETIVAADTASGGTTYYVDSTIGDDSNSGTSPETPCGIQRSRITIFIIPKGGVKRCDSVKLRIALAYGAFLLG